MIVNVWLVVSVVGGGIAGLGVYFALTAFRSPAPALGPALRRLHPVSTMSTLGPEAAPRPAFSLSWLEPDPRDLQITNRTAQGHMLAMGLAAVLGLLLPALFGIAAVALGLSIPFTVPVVVAVMFALCGVLFVHFEMKSRARAARLEFVRALCTYVTLTAHQVRSGHGAVEGMERAAGICDGWPFARLRAALLTAQLQMTQPWDELHDVAEAIGVIELSAFADIMRSAGTDGAQVYQTLQAQAESLRDQIRVRGMERAKRQTSQLDIPSTMLIMVLLALVIYPVMMNLFENT